MSRRYRSNPEATHVLQRLLAMAKDPTTPADELADIAEAFAGKGEFADPLAGQVLEAVALNPQTPLRVMLRVAKKQPDEVLRNAGVELEAMSGDRNAALVLGQAMASYGFKMLNMEHRAQRDTGAEARAVYWSKQSGLRVQATTPTEVPYALLDHAGLGNFERDPLAYGATVLVGCIIAAMLMFGAQNPSRVLGEDDKKALVLAKPYTKFWSQQLEDIVSRMTPNRRRRR